MRPCYLQSTRAFALRFPFPCFQTLYLVRLSVTCCTLMRHTHPRPRGSATLPTSHNPRTYAALSSTPIMSHTLPASTSSSNFQLILSNALKMYERRTKKDLLDHPLAAQLQNCDSHSSILTVLQQQVQDLNRSQSSDERLTKWLDPTVKVLYILLETVGEGVNLVCPVISKSLRYGFSYLFYRCSRPRKRSLLE